jgi:hypothetical protein
MEGFQIQGIGAIASTLLQDRANAYNSKMEKKQVWSIWRSRETQLEKGLVDLEKDFFSSLSELELEEAGIAGINLALEASNNTINLGNKVSGNRAKKLQLFDMHNKTKLDLVRSMMAEKQKRDSTLRAITARRRAKRRHSILSTAIKVASIALL